MDPAILSLPLLCVHRGPSFASRLQLVHQTQQWPSFFDIARMQGMARHMASMHLLISDIDVW